jgi:serine/threonine protein kinase
MHAAAESTEPGRVMGTPSYMAPEQVRGEAVDHRADIFAFGCVLYEMLSGQRPFKRDTAISTMAAIMNDEPPDLSAAKPDLSPALARIVHRCLEKQPDRRFHSAHDLAFAIESAGQTCLVLHRAADQFRQDMPQHLHCRTSEGQLALS